MFESAEAGNGARIADGQEQILSECIRYRGAGFGIMIVGGTERFEDQLDKVNAIQMPQMYKVHCLFLSISNEFFVQPSDPRFRFVLFVAFLLQDECQKKILGVRNFNYLTTYR